jgi:hypothetical protein
MIDPLEEQTVAQFVLETEANLDTAIRMARVLPKLQLDIVQPVLDELEKKLRSKLGKDWKIWNSRNEVLVSRYAGFTVSRKSWGEIYVDLETQVREGTNAVGIWRKKGPQTASLDSALADAFAKAKLSGNANKWWAWYQHLPPDRGNWNAAPALAAMHFRRAEVVDYLTDQILLVHRLATPVIDAFTSKK